MATDWFNELNNINVNELTEKKDKLNYLSWMWAWQELKKRYPLSYATVHETEDGMLVWKDPIGCHVKTSVTIVWEENGEQKSHTATEYLPCMDFRNKAVPYENVDAMLVNKTVQRSLTKCIARLGLGAYLYANEDLPEEEARVVALQGEITELAKKKSALSAKAKDEAIAYCKQAEKEANPDLDDDIITGKVTNIEDINILETLKKKLLKIRK